MKNLNKSKGKSNKIIFDDHTSEIDEENKKFWEAVEKILSANNIKGKL